MEDKRPDATPPGEHASEASGEQQGKEGLAELATMANEVLMAPIVGPVLEDPPQPTDRAIGRRQRGVPGRPQAPEKPRNRAGEIPQQGVGQDPDPVARESNLKASVIAAVAYSTVQAYKMLGLKSQDVVYWDELSDEVKQSITAQVIAAMTGQAGHPARNHDRWCKYMRSKGVTAEDDPRVGTAYFDLPPEERRKAVLFEAVVVALLKTG